VQPDELPDRISGVLDRLKSAERELSQLKVGAVLAGAGRLAEQAEQIGSVQLVAAEAPPGVGGNDLRTLALDVRGRLRPSEPAVVLLASPTGAGGAAFVAAVNQAGQSAGLAAGDVVRTFAQGAGGDQTQMADAFAAVRAGLAGTRA
jgi:alanyl-tRNA synthetase